MSDMRQVQRQQRFMDALIPAGPLGGPSIVAKINGGTGVLEGGLFRKMSDERAEAYAREEIYKTSKFEKDCDPDLLAGLKLLEAKGEVIAVRSGGETIYNDADLSGTGYLRDRAGNRIDSMKPTHDEDGFIDQGHEDFSEEAA